MKNLSIAAALSGFLLFPALPAAAANSLDIVINEIAWMGVKIENVESKNWWRYEWLELYNNAESPVSLENWKIELYRDQLDWQLDLSKTIPAKSYYLVVASDKISPNFDINYANLAGKFVNSGQKVILKDAKGKIIDEVDCASGWFSGGNTTKQTMERIYSNLPGSDPGNWKNSEIAGGTPKTKNSAAEEPLLPSGQQNEEKTENGSLVAQLGEKQTTFLSGIVFNEILPSPNGPDENEEWIEIFNQNNFEADISGWKIEDANGKTTIYAVPEGSKITANGFLVFKRPETKITLNNESDGLKISTSDNKIIDQISYPKAPLGQSYNKIKGAWAWSNILTPGSVNIAPTQKFKEEKTLLKNDALKNNEFRDKKSLATISAGAGKTLPPFLIASLLAAASGATILFLKRKLI